MTQSRFINQKSPIRELVPGLLKRTRQIEFNASLHSHQCTTLARYAADSIDRPPPASAMTKLVSLTLYSPVSAWDQKQTPYLFGLLSPSPIA
jgi:hypothetical protein